MLFFCDFSKMLIVILEKWGGATGFAKGKYSGGSIMLTTGAHLSRQRPNYWCQGGEGVWLAEVGITDRRTGDPTPPF